MNLTEMKGLQGKVQDGIAKILSTPEAKRIFAEVVDMAYGDRDEEFRQAASTFIRGTLSDAMAGAIVTLLRLQWHSTSEGT